MSHVNVNDGIELPRQPGMTIMVAEFVVGNVHHADHPFKAPLGILLGQSRIASKNKHQARLSQPVQMPRPTLP